MTASVAVTPLLVLLLILGPFAIFVVWLLIDSGRTATAGGSTPEGNPSRLRAQQRLTDVVGGGALLAYLVAIFAGWLRPRSTLEGVILAVAFVAYVLFSMRRSVRSSLPAKEASEFQQLRQALLMLTTFGIILGIAGWLAAAHN